MRVVLARAKALNVSLKKPVTSVADNDRYWLKITTQRPRRLSDVTAILGKSQFAKCFRTVSRSLDWLFDPLKGRSIICII
jgi:hypothetical protein